MSQPLAYRSPGIVALLQRTQETAQFLPPSDQACADLFPPPYIEDGPRATRVVSNLHAEPPRFNLCGLIVGLILYGFVAVGVLAMVFGALSFALWALGSSGRPA